MSQAAQVRLAPSSPVDVLGVPTIIVPYVTLRLPFVANWYRHEWLWPLLRNVLVREAARHDGATVIHAQHVQSVPGAVLAGREMGVPVVATVRDHWPWDYFATGLHADRVPYPANTLASLLTDLPVRLGPVRGVMASAAIPYMLGHLRRRQMALAEAGAVVAVSRYIARRLANVISPARVHVIPNIVDVEAIQETVAHIPAGMDLEEPFLLFVGKLERNKGAHLLPDVLVAAREARGEAPLPELVVAGSGSLTDELRHACAARDLRVRLLGETDHTTVLQLMNHATVLISPSTWGEPLIRVLLEASAAGACIATMPTGGTSEIVDDGHNGLLRLDATTLGRAVAHLLQEPELRARLRTGALATARARWTPEIVGARFEALYHTLIAGRQ
jgi:glycosyltransferase involved in cell wall biosynthesis